MRILQLIDSLEIGGAERMAVNYANALQTEVALSALCVTRSEGALKELISQEVPYLFLNRKHTLDPVAVFRLRRFIKKHQIELVQAHGSSYFIATLVKLLTPQLKLVWHDHYGNSAYLAQRKSRILTWCSRHFDAVFSVNESLKTWAQERLDVDCVFYVKNFIAAPLAFEAQKDFQGVQGKRIVCVANFRPQKNHHLLLDAFQDVLRHDSAYSLHLFGYAPDTLYANSLLERLESPPFKGTVFYHEVYLKMSAILPHFDIGVLSSDSEGLPLVLLEYGQAGLPVIVTDVGQCAEVLGNLGKVIPQNNKNSLKDAILDYDVASSKEIEKFRNRVNKEYGEKQILIEVVQILNQIM